MLMNKEFILVMELVVLGNNSLSQRVADGLSRSPMYIYYGSSTELNQTAQVFVNRKADGIVTVGDVVYVVTASDDGGGKKGVTEFDLNGNELAVVNTVLSFQFKF